MEGRMKLAYYEGVFKEALESCPSEDVRAKATTVKEMENFMERGIAELPLTNCLKLIDELKSMKYYTAERIIPVGAKYMLTLVGEYDSRIMEMQAKIDELKACKDVMVAALGVKYIETFMSDSGETRNKDITGSSYVARGALCLIWWWGGFLLEAREPHQRHGHQGGAEGGAILKELASSTMAD